MVDLHVLGTAQDGGIPHFDCKCRNCRSHERMVASVALQGDEVVMVDATPDISRQFQLLKMGSISDLSGIIITHLHIGHYIGLLQLGKEVANTRNLPVYLTDENYQFLLQNKPFSYLIRRSQIIPQIIKPNSTYEISSDYRIKPIEVPHRNEDGNTIALLIATSDYTALYLPDCDYINTTIVNLVNKVDVILFDGTFYSDNEVNRQANIPHPPMIETMERFASNIDTKQFYFTHFNHTNPILSDIEVQNTVKRRGFQLAFDDLRLQL